MNEPNEWNDGGPSKDDFTARMDDGYVLRAEDMGGYWYWQVYTPHGEAMNAGCDLSVTNEYSAKGIAVLVYRLHSKKHV